MSEAAVRGWIGIALLGVMTPGIDTILVLRDTITGGRRSGLTAVAGIALGSLTWAVASLVGLTALLTSSHLAYNLVRTAGAAYLMWLGASALWKTLPRTRHTHTSEQTLEATQQVSSPWAALRAGALTNLLNPKVGVFYISLLPQFLPTGPSATAWGAILVAIHLIITFLWYPAIIWTATKARKLLLRQRVRRWLDRATAGVLIGLGINLAAGPR
jgi:threonine/homoserine/homoserine lactone efflux protein